MQQLQRSVIIIKREWVMQKMPWVVILSKVVVKERKIGSRVGAKTRSWLQ